jgi:membrane glycosyltransferase
MEANPSIGLIQTLPIITGGSTLFARLQQFASRVYGPLIAHGIAWWHGAEGNYWGHNAVIRTRAFAEHAGLPELSGRKPFGGPILSHDFIEAALLRRAGWAVHMVPALSGSYEESPPNLTDLAVRDRRWCQGNLQHIAILPARGLHWISRLHLLTGIASYLTAPLWLLFLLASILVTLQARFVLPDYFPTVGKSLFPVWPVIDPVRAMWMFVGTMGLLLTPKLLGFLVVLTRGAERRGCGGSLRLLAGLLLETLISGLLAPVVMLTQAAAVVAIFMGRDSGWKPQRRDDGALPLGETVRRYRGHTTLGIAMGSAAWLVSPSLALWMSPVVLGLVLAIPLALWTGGRGAFARLGLLRTPEELHPPPVLARATSLACEFSRVEPAALVLPDRLLRDPALLSAHRDMLPPARRRWIDPVEIPLLTGCAKLTEAPDLALAWEAMSRDERITCLADAETLDLIIARARDERA